MAHIENGYLVIKRNDYTDIGTVESILEDLSMEADPFVADGATQAREFLMKVFDSNNLKYEDSVGEWKLAIYEPDAYDDKGNCGYGY